MQKNKYTSIFYVFFIFLILGIGNEAKASHAMGGDFSYVCIGNGAYSINLRIFRDCNGISLGQNANVTFTSPTCGTVNVNLQNLGGAIIRTPLCPSAASNGACLPNGNGTYGIEEMLYRGTVNLPVNCGNDWTMSWSLCCRNNAITTLTNGSSESMYIDAQLDNTAAANCNNSPAFNTDPTFFLCMNQENRYTSAAVDTEGDDLVYSFIDCRSAATTSVSYVSPLSGINPLVATTQTIDSETGEIVIYPTSIQTAVICIQVEEFRNGIKIGEIIRDLQFEVTACQTNTLPILSGINGTADSSGTTGLYEIEICAGVESTFTIQGFDAEAVPSAQSQNLEVTWNYGIQGASFITDYNLPYPVSEFKWTPTLADVGEHVFFIGAGDDACPILGSNVYAYKVTVLPEVSVAINMFAPTVPKMNPSPNLDTADLEVLTGTGNPNYSWSPTVGLSCTDCPNPQAYPGITTNYTVTVLDETTGCVNTEDVLVEYWSISTTRIPENLSTWNVFPNPVTEYSVLDYELTTNSDIKLELYDMLGQRIALIAEEKQPKGKYQYQIGKYLAKQAKGMYFVSMEVDGKQVTQKLMIR
jgi:hypothetical protein